MFICLLLHGQREVYIMINSGGVKGFFHSQQVDIAGGKDDNFKDFMF
jgi:hypothetical protein